MILQQTQNVFSTLAAQFTLIPLMGIMLMISGKIRLQDDVLSVVGLILILPIILLAPLIGWVNDRFSKPDVILAASISQIIILSGICAALALHNIPLILCGLFGIGLQSAFCSPAKIGLNKELLGSQHVGFTSGIQQMAMILAILTGWILSEQRFVKINNNNEAWEAAFVMLLVLTSGSFLTANLVMAVPRVPAQGRAKFTTALLVSHFTHIAELWRNVPMRRASLGVTMSWSFMILINLSSAKMARMIPFEGENFENLSFSFVIANLLGMASGFGFTAYLLRRKVELGWVPIAGIAMTSLAIALAFATSNKYLILSILSLLGFFGAVFIAPLAAWMQDHYPAEKRGLFQSAANLQNSIAALLAIVLIRISEYATQVFKIPETIIFRFEIAFIGIACGIVTLSVLRLLPSDFIRLIGGSLIRQIYRIKVVNSSIIPAKGGALLLPNHVTFADGLFISAACPRPVRFLMDEAFMAKRSIRLFVSIFDTVTICKDQPREAIRITINALENGDVVCLFPEGQLTRTGSLNELRRGFELIAKKAEKPLIPVWCDGSWGSIFSFERGRFFRKIPYRQSFGMTIAFGNQIHSSQANINFVRQQMLATSATAIGNVFSHSTWGRRIPKGPSERVRFFSNFSESYRRRFWINGYQIGQVGALQRHCQFMGISNDQTLTELFSIALTFPELFEARLETHQCLIGNLAASWVGGDLLREEIKRVQILAEVIFYDFGNHALMPISCENLIHCPCLAVDGFVIAMSMPDPSIPNAESEIQRGSKLGTWGKLLPGWYLLPSESGSLVAHGPAAPSSGLTLPSKCYLDSEGFLASGEISNHNDL